MWGWLKICWYVYMRDKPLEIKKVGDMIENDLSGRRI